MSESRHKGLRSAAHTQPELHDSILQSAEKLFRTLGYLKVTVGDIAKDLGMSPANIYRFFASKVQLREALAERFTHQVEEACRRVAESDGRRTPTERLMEMIVEYHRMTLDRYITSANVHEMLNVALRENWNVVLVHKAHILKIFEQLIAEGVQEGEFVVNDISRASLLVFHSIAVFTDPSKVALLFVEDNCCEVKDMSRFVVGALKAGVV